MILLNKGNILLLLGFLLMLSCEVRANHSNVTCKYECDEINDMHCKSTFACEQNYRMCCNGKCTLKKEPCENKRSNSNLDKLNGTEFEQHWEEVIKNISKYIDSVDCYPKRSCINETACKPKYRQCEDGKCVLYLSQCEKFWVYSDDTKEKNSSTCYPDEFCMRQKCSKRYWMCDDGECIYKSLVCRGGLQCTDGSDEEYCDGDCFPPYRCKDGDCKFGYYKCGNGQCILQEEVCDTIKNCPEGSDELECQMQCWPPEACTKENSCKSGYFPCDQGKCISSTRVCNNIQDCYDGTDEIKRGFGFKCNIGKQMQSCVIPEPIALDNFTRCPDHSDSCNVNGTSSCFNCLDGRLVISGKQKCDGVIDCHDLSDECFCEDQSIPTCNTICTHASTYDRQLTVNDLQQLYSDDKMLYNDLTRHKNLNENTGLYNLPTSVNEWCMCSPGQFDCGNGNCLHVSKLCDGINDCLDSTSNGLDEQHCIKSYLAEENTILCPGNVKNTTLIRAVVCDGRPQCFDLSDECMGNCNFSIPFCEIKYKLQDAPFEFMCNVKTKYTFFDVNDLCDGVWTDCFPRMDSEEMGCPARFYCESQGKISIDKNLVCDGVPQCDDMSDEVDCPNLFYCENGIPFSVPRKKMTDGIADCSDLSDECPSDMDENAFSSSKELLSSSVLLAMVWIFAILAIFGNATTFIGSAYSMRGYSKMNPVARINNLLLLNLSMADFLMGVYLVILLYYSQHFSGQYCKHDKAWRTSSVCSNLGALALLSSEASVMILVSMTSLRLYSVLQPFKVKTMPIYIPIMGLVISWILAILLGVLPKVEAFKGYFISAVHLTTNFAGSDTMNLNDFFRFVHRLAVTKPTENTPPVSESWNKLSKYFLENYKHLEVKLSGYVGYYSETSVCLPKFYVSMGDVSWEFSFALVVFNFLAFVFVCVAYWIIFRRTRAANNKRSEKLKKIQTRIMLLILTDFLCWMPVTVMAVLQLGGVEIPKIAYAISAVVLLPINSAVNPLLYSDITSGHILSMFRLFVTACSKSSALCSNILRLIGRNKVDENCGIDKQSGVYLGRNMSLKPSSSSNHSTRHTNQQTIVSEMAF